MINTGAGSSGALAAITAAVAAATVIATAGWGWPRQSWAGRRWRWKWIFAVRAIDVVPIDLARVGNNAAECEAGDGRGDRREEFLWDLWD